jgi:hypothetical protein
MLVSSALLLRQADTDDVQRLPCVILALLAQAPVLVQHTRLRRAHVNQRVFWLRSRNDGPRENNLLN